MNLAYCDYIAFLARSALRGEDDMHLLQSISKINFDLDDAGIMRSTTKTILITDKNGKHYKLTVEEV